ncbi:hypothetical protein C8R42DRAFT_683986 [Lentinula raphanica]|nr:hypothetical protein C8R42DRAFT_683986 [Lentinula raphanica]
MGLPRQFSRPVYRKNQAKCTTQDTPTISICQPLKHVNVQHLESLPKLLRQHQTRNLIFSIFRKLCNVP